MSNAKKIIAIITVTLVVMSLFAVSYAVSKGFNPLMIPVDKENLPEHILEGDLEDGHISAHRLEEISKEIGKTVSLESTNGRTYEARHNMVLSEETVVDTAKEAFLTALGEYMKKINSIDFSTYDGENREKVESLVREYSDKEFEYSPEAMEELKGEMAAFEERLAEIPTGPVVTAAVTNPEPVTSPEPTVEPESTTVSEGVSTEPLTQPQAPAEPPHEHTWVNITETVYHEAEGHYEEVVVQDAWDEEVTEIDNEGVWTDCSWMTGGGLIFYGWTNDECRTQYMEWWRGLSDEELENTATNYSASCKNPPTKTTIVHHEAVTETQWIEDKPAWTEDVVTGRKCASCGATE